MSELTLAAKLGRIVELWRAMAFPANVAQAGVMYDEMDTLVPALSEAADALEACEKALRRIKDRAGELRGGTDDWFELTEFEIVAAEALSKIEGVQK